MSKEWYVIHTQTGWEDKVKASLEKRIKQSAKEDLISQILIPTERISEVKEGKKRISQRKFFPGYILVEMELDDETWYLVKAGSDWALKGYNTLEPLQTRQKAIRDYLVQYGKEDGDGLDDKTKKDIRDALNALEKDVAEAEIDFSDFVADITRRIGELMRKYRDCMEE